MPRIFIILSMIVSLFNSNYKEFIEIETIECKINKNENITLTYNFNSDSFSKHNLLVVIDIYSLNNKLIKSYSNSLLVNDKVTKTAILDYKYDPNIYLITSIKENNEDLVSGVKFSLIDNKDCNLKKENLSCNQVYKLVYSKGVVTQKYSKFRVIRGYFDNYLNDNYLDLEKIKIYSLYDFSKDNIYLKINNKIKGYKLNYDDGYLFLLKANNKDGYITFSLLEDYYLNLNDFEFKENYSNKDLKVKGIYFPFLNEYKEYDFSIFIEGYTNIKIDFRVGCSDLLFGKCSNSKYCLKVIDYD